MTKRVFLTSLSLLLFTLFSCSGGKSPIAYDKEAGLSRSKFKNLMTDPEARNNAHPEIVDVDELPDLSQVLSPPQPPKVAEGKLVSLTVTEDIPIKDVLIELSRLANIEMEIDPFIGGGVILIVKDRPFMEVIERICNLSNLRYSVSNGLLIIERDLPYIVNYSVPYLDVSRSYTSSVSVSTKTGSDELSSGGESELSISSEGDVWDALIADIEKVIGSSAEEENSNEYISSNKRAGVVTVSTTQKRHKDVSAYISKVKESVMAQVLIEAKIVEVTLSDEFQSGIDWTKVNAINSASSGNLTKNLTNATNAFSFAIKNTRNNVTNLDATLKMIESFGTTRTLSSPRLTAVNNQQAILTFTENKIFFEVEYDSTTTAGNATSTETTITSEIKTVPVGIILSMQPSINLEKEEVLMNIRPTISTTPSVVSDPAVALIAAKESATITSEVPVIKLQELDTLLKIKSGDVMVIGGLIEQSHSNLESGVPILKNIPLLGYFFKSKAKTTSLKETVIFIKATIIGNNHKIDKSDKNFYKSFTNDPNSLDL